MPAWGYLLIVFAVALIILVVLYIAGDKLQKKQTAQREQMTAAAQPATMFVIGKKYMKLKEANLPKMVMDQTPKRMRGAKMPIVKAKIGPQIMNLICDEAIFDDVPVKGEVKAMISGIYIVSVKNVRGKVEAPVKKKGIGAKMRDKQKVYQKQLIEESKQKEIDKRTKEEKKKAEERAKKVGQDRI